MNIKKPSAESFKRWQNNRFGMFIHWGIYSLPARHEWVKNREKITDDDYEKYFRNFNPDLYNPEEWARKAVQAGIKYAVLTTKHHDGFCLWNTSQTDYNSMNTPCGKDLVKMYADAFRREGIRIGFYYSLLDWHHPEYTLDPRHPMYGNSSFTEKNQNRRMSIYAEYMRRQITELLSEYGEIDMMFFDFSIRDYEKNIMIKGRREWESEELIKLVRRLQPEMLVNDRLDLDEYEWGWDFTTPEQIAVRSVPLKNGKPVPWEACHTFSGSWGYFRDEQSWKSSEQLIKLLVDTVSKGGNLLLNVGPTARGDFDERANDRLEKIGAWMKKNSAAIYNCTCAPDIFTVPPDCRLTYNPEDKRLFIHIFSYPPTGELYIEGSGTAGIKYAQFLHDGSEIQFGARKPWQMRMENITGIVKSFKLPVLKPAPEVPVIECFLE